MGRSAKLHKRNKKASTLTPTKTGGSAQVEKTAVVASSKKKAGLKDKAAASKRTSGAEGHVLGEADYVGMMMGGRRKARKEAEKMPVDEDE
ncbi:hypothetical protein OF83DRAFT_1177140 [Amylostereum chailletii]|nr:hypothetical protein OF83DRAFT_1177140 [Amylostereum chailletii]